MVHVPEFELERFQSLYEHEVDFNLAESGVDPLTTAELLDPGEIERLVEVPLAYAQTNGPMELRKRIAHHLGAEASNVLVTSATIEANFISAWKLFEPGDELAYMVPNYLQIGGLAESFGATVRTFELEEELNWQPDPRKLEGAITERTKLVALVNPNNPLGVVLDSDSMQRIVELAERVGAWVLVDEIYRGTEHNGEMTPSFWGTYDRVLVTGSLSKAYGLPGLRIGWVIGPPDFIDDLWSRKDYTSITAATLSYEIATHALEPQVTSRILGRNRKLVVHNLEVLRDWVKDQEGLSLASPVAGAMTLIGYQHDIGSVDLADRIHREKSVLIVPGAHFGLEKCLRIGYGIPTAELEEALERMSQVFADIQKGTGSN